MSIRALDGRRVATAGFSRELGERTCVQLRGFAIRKVDRGVLEAARQLQALLRQSAWMESSRPEEEQQ